MTVVGVFSDTQMVYGVTEHGSGDAEAEIELTEEELAAYYRDAEAMYAWQLRFAQAINAARRREHCP